MAERIPVKDNYILSRGFGANTRQNLQHYLWKDGIGYLLHPSIPTDVEDLRVAEIGVGTGIWLIELSRILKPSARLDGLDISHAQCPPVEFIPSNISLRIHDCLSEPPSDLLEQYDIIHIQCFNSVVPDNDPVPVVRNMLKMLKPGGYISWGEFDFLSWITTTTASANGYNDELNTLLEYNATFGHTRPKPNFLAHNWTAQLPQIFSNLGMTNIIVDRRPFSKEIATYVLDTFMVAGQEISVNVLDSIGGGRGDIARRLIEAVDRNRRNIGLSLDRLTVIGQKLTA